MGRRIRIIRNKRPEVLRNAGVKFPQPKPSHGAGDEPSRPYWCMWCYYEKTNPKEKCGCCGKLGATSTPQKKISQVYLEDNTLESR